MSTEEDNKKICKLENEELIILVNTIGAELVSIQDRASGMNYLWNGDPAYWMRRSPILFPFVGWRNQKQYRHEGREYEMGIHGFARDMEFELRQKTKNAMTFCLKSTEETKMIYPFSFELYITYRLVNRILSVEWKVLNPNSKTMYFQIGAHPGFYCPMMSGEKQSDYYLSFDKKKELEITLIHPESGLAKSETKKLPLLDTQFSDGYLQIDEHLFDDDALVIEGRQCSKVALCQPDYSAYVTVTFDTSVVGIWSPAGKQAPFVCIEPWYGRCDSDCFTGELKDMEYINLLEPGNEFCKSYQIELHAIN